MFIFVSSLICFFFSFFLEWGNKQLGYSVGVFVFVYFGFVYFGFLYFFFFFFFCFCFFWEGVFVFRGWLNIQGIHWVMGQKRDIQSYGYPEPNRHLFDMTVSGITWDYGWVILTFFCKFKEKFGAHYWMSALFRLGLVCNLLRLFLSKFFGWFFDGGGVFC